MSLSYNLMKIKNYEAVCYGADGAVTEITSTLVWLMAVIGMPGITKATAKPVYRRIAMYESLFGSFRPLGHITMEQVLAHVGLTTNVAFETDAKWERRITKSFSRVADHSWDVAETDRTNAERLRWPPVLDRNRLDRGGTDNV